jgi:hypothetical protein
MQEHTRAHGRLEKKDPEGRQVKLTLGDLFISKAVKPQSTIPLIIHFLGPDWLPDSTAVAWHRAVAVVNISVGAGSGVFERAFADPATFAKVISEAKAAAQCTFSPVIITSFSAGYGSVRAILRDPKNWPMIDGIVLEDSLHTSYVPDGIPGPLDTTLLKPFVDFAKVATENKKRMLIIHSEIYPGTYASTTETADYILDQLGLKRTAVLKWGPHGMQQLSDVKQGSFHVMGFAGPSGPDHIDILHGEETWLRTLWP